MRALRRMASTFVNARDFYLLPPQKRLLLLAMDWTRPKDPPFSLGQASILANLKRHDISVIPKAWSVNRKDFKVETVYDFVMEHANENTDLALGTYVWHEPQTQSFLNALRRNHFPGRIILGGPQVSYVKRGLEKFYPQADIFIRGYAEEALAQLLLSHANRVFISGVHYAGEPDLSLTAVAELSALPSPFLQGIITPQQFIRWETQRGCPFRCAFCQHRESDLTRTRRQFSSSRIMPEIDWIVQNSAIREIAVLDPTFNTGPSYIEVMDALIAKKYTGRISFQCRIEMVKNDFLTRIKALNETAQVVLEFGLQTIHRTEEKVIQRPNNKKRISEVLNQCREFGINTEVSLIFGLPNQTVKTFEASIDFCKEHSVSAIYAFPLMLLRGTELYERKTELGLVESTDIADLEIDRVQTNISHVIASPSFTYQEWQAMASLAESLNNYNKNAKITNVLQQTLWKFNVGKAEGNADTSVFQQNTQIIPNAGK